MLVFGVGHDLERAHTLVVAYVARRWHLIDMTIDGERKNWHPCVGCLLEAGERLQTEVVCQRVGYFGLELYQLHQLLELFLGH